MSRFFRLPTSLPKASLSVMVASAILAACGGGGSDPSPLPVSGNPAVAAPSSSIATEVVSGAPVPNQGTVAGMTKIQLDSQQVAGGIVQFIPESGTSVPLLADQDSQGQYWLPLTTSNQRGMLVLNKDGKTQELGAVTLTARETMEHPGEAALSYYSASLPPLEAAIKVLEANNLYPSLLQPLRSSLTYRQQFIDTIRTLMSMGSDGSVVIASTSRGEEIRLTQADLAALDQYVLYLGSLLPAYTEQAKKVRTTTVTQLLQSLFIREAYAATVADCDRYIGGKTEEIAAKRAEIVASCREMINDADIDRLDATIRIINEGTKLLAQSFIVAGTGGAGTDAALKLGTAMDLMTDAVVATVRLTNGQFSEAARIGEEALLKVALNRLFDQRIDAADYKKFFDEIPQSGLRQPLEGLLKASVDWTIDLTKEGIVKLVDNVAPNAQSSGIPQTSPTPTSQSPACSITGGGSLTERFAHMTMVNDGTPCVSFQSDAKSITITKQAQHGVVDIVGGRIRYRPNPGFVGEDSFEEFEVFTNLPIPDFNTVEHWGVTVNAP